MSCGYAYPLSVFVLIAYDALDKHVAEVPHIADYNDEIVPLSIAAILSFFALRCCELCGSWMCDKLVVRRIRIVALGYWTYGCAAGLGIPDIPNLWRYAVGLQAASLVSNGGLWLDQKGEEDQADSASQTVEKEACPV